MENQSKNKAIAIFEGTQIRRHWNEKKELWYFSVSDVIAVLTKSVDPVAYWRKLKQRWAYFLLNHLDPYLARRQWRGLPK